MSQDLNSLPPFQQGFIGSNTGSVARAETLEALRNLLFVLDKHRSSGQPDERLSDPEYLLRLATGKDRKRSFQDFKDMAAISRCGWFIDGHMPTTWIGQIATHIRGSHRLDGKHSYIHDQDVDDFMTKYLTDEYERIKSSILQSFPSRSRSIQDALFAFEQDKHSLCIPALILQADGAFRDCTGVSLFSSNKGNMEATYRDLLKNVEGGNDDYELLRFHQCLALVFHAVRSTRCPFNESTKGMRVNEMASFNRHAILHGMIVDYGTRTNSLRYFNLMGSLCLLPSISEDIDGHK